MPPFGSPTGMGSGSGNDYPDPFMDVASANMPLNIRTALRSCERIWLKNGTYRMAQQRILSYFLTDIEPYDCSDDEREQYLEFAETIGLLNAVQQLLIDTAAYGNGFATLLLPFKRILCCKRCGAQHPLKVVFTNPDFKFHWDNYEFKATCQSPSCNYTGPWNVNDIPESMEKRLQVKHWNPHEIELLHDLMTGDVAYLWRIPEDYKLQIRRGNLFHLERAPLPVIQAIKHNITFRFHPDVMFHMREATPSGVRNRGWGIPRILSNFSQIYYVQTLQRYNEALVLDYVIPFRLITPVARTGASAGGLSKTLDPLLNQNMGDFSGQVRSMIRRRRRDPASWFVLPFPVQYQALGGDASQLVPQALLDQGFQRLLNDAGTPVELYNGSLSVQTAPVALRLFEATNLPLIRNANQFLQWFVQQVSQRMQWEAVKMRLKRVTYADDMTRQMAILQLFTGQQISGETALGMLGLGWSDEQRRIAEEAKRQSEIQSKVQKEMDQEGLSQQMVNPQQGGAGGAGGAAPAQGQPAGGGSGQTPGAGPAPLPGQQEAMEPVTAYINSHGTDPQMDVEGMSEDAGNLAQQLSGLPQSTRTSELRKLKKWNESLHAIVGSKLSSLRSDAAQKGQQALEGGQNQPQGSQ